MKSNITDQLKVTVCNSASWKVDIWAQQPYNSPSCAPEALCWLAGIVYGILLSVNMDR